LFYRRDAGFLGGWIADVHNAKRENIRWNSGIDERKGLNVTLLQRRETPLNYCATHQISRHPMSVLREKSHFPRLFPRFDKVSALAAAVAAFI
jgi:hypothetical protein